MRWRGDEYVSCHVKSLGIFTPRQCDLKSVLLSEYR